MNLALIHIPPQLVVAYTEDLALKTLLAFILLKLLKFTYVLNPKFVMLLEVQTP